MNIKADELVIDFKPLISFSPLTLQSTSSVAQALTLMTAQIERNDDASNQNSVLVIAQKKLVGRVTTQQIMALCAQGDPLGTLALEAVMLPPEEVIYDSELGNVTQVVDCLQRSQLSEIPVLNQQEEVVGLLKRDRAWEAIARQQKADLSRKLATQQFLHQLSQQIRFAPTIQEALNWSTQRIRDFFRCDRALIYQLQGQSKNRVVAEATNNREQPLLWKQLSALEPDQECLDAYCRGEVQIVTDVSSSTGRVTEQAEWLNAEIGAHLIAPIGWEGKVWGLLMVSERETHHQWTSTVVERVKQVGQQCAIALQEFLTDHNLRREIKKRKQAQRDLEKRQQQLLNIANSVPGGIYQFIATPEGKWSFPFANQGALDLFGISAEVDFSVAQHWFDQIHPDDLQKVKSKIEMALRHKTRWQCEFRVINSQGIHWVDGIADIPDQLEDGSLVFNGVVLDITERKNAEKGWRTLVEGSKNFTNKNFLASVVEYIANTLQVNWVMVSRKEGNVVRSKAIWGNGALQPNVTLSLTEESPCVDIIRLQNYNGFIYQDNVQDNFPNNELLKAVDAKIYIGTPLFNLQQEVIGSLCIFDHQSLTATSRIKSILDVFADRIAVEWERTEALANLQALNEDLENQVAARTADLEKRNQELDSFFSVSLDLLCIADTQGYFCRLNRRWEHVLGYSLTELKSQHSSYFIHPDDQEATESALRVLQRGEPMKYFINRYRCADGSYRWLEWSAVRVGKKIYAAAHDITRRKQDQEYLEQTNAELERANRLKDEFLANMSHELRTPMNSILGMTEALQEQVYGNLNSRQLKSLETIRRSGTHLLELINDILDLSKIEAGKLELQTANLSIQHLCTSTVSLVREMAQQKQIALEMELPPQLPTIRGDEQRLRQALLNLLSNAIKFTPTGGTITLKVKPINRGVEIAFSVIDTGIGIAETDLPQLFKPFMQLETQLSRQTKGTGLGLSLVKRIAELHHGKVTVESTLGEGSCFTVILPYAQGKMVEPEQGSQSEKRTGCCENSDQARPLPKILIADDDEANLLTICSYLEAKGYPLVVAKNGRSAIALALSEQPDLILMDIQMPELDGLEAIRQLRAEPHALETPIIALTAFAMAGDEEKCFAAGANHYLPKPIRLRELVDLMQSIISGH
ncbi:MAG: PAS domain S-box protein [Cyanobacteria bacterium]|jgi:PAS domain S-box-containing protein|nr:PAS domain S-box protein [Cyanobacteria bacterium GSL.Bin21]